MWLLRITGIDILAVQWCPTQRHTSTTFDFNDKNKSYFKSFIFRVKTKNIIKLLYILIININEMKFWKICLERKINFKKLWFISHNSIVCSTKGAFQDLPRPFILLFLLIANQVNTIGKQFIYLKTHNKYLQYVEQCCCSKQKPCKCY